MKLDPIDVIGFSAGGYIAAEMLAADQRIFSKAVLVAPMGIRPEQGEIFDIFPITIRTHLRATVADPFKTPEFAKLYGGEMTAEQFEAFEDARAEAARIGWEPYMHNPSLPHLLHGTKTPTLLVWGTADHVVPRGCIDAYKKAIPGCADRDYQRRWTSARDRKLGRVRTHRNQISDCIATRRSGLI